MPSEDFMEKIEQLVSDENRIVTYKILSHELKIHVNKAKQYLLEYFNAQKLKGISIAVHYFLAGFVEVDGTRTIKVIIIPEDKLEDTKKSFTEITSCHIYSIYKGDAKDECALYSADFSYIKDKEEQNKYSAIKHPNVEIQPPVLNKMQINNDVKSNTDKKVESCVKENLSVNSKKNSNKVQSNVSPEKNNSSIEEDKDPKKNKTSPEDKKQKSSTLMSMWQKKESKPNGLKKENSTAEVKGKTTAKIVPKNSIMSMFSKQAVKNPAKLPVSKSSVPKDEENSKIVLPDISEKKESSNGGKTNENKKVSQKRKASNKHSKQSSTLMQNSDSENEFQPKAKKKHRRICTFDDSDSESETEEDRDKAQRSFFLPEEPINIVEAPPVSDDEDPIPPTPPVIHVKGKAKIWKTVQKTYEDEDGFFVTKTEKELVSISEDEEEPIKVKPVKKEEELINKKSISVNKKQSSLMSFFKQK